MSWVPFWLVPNQPQEKSEGVAQVAFGPRHRTATAKSGDPRSGRLTRSGLVRPECADLGTSAMEPGLGQ